MVPNIANDTCYECDCIEKMKHAYWNSLAYLVYAELEQKEPSVIQDNQKLMTCIQDNQKLMTCLRESVDNWKTNAYWLWQDLLDILDFTAPENQDWIDDTSPEEQEDAIIKAIIYPDEFGKTCWYWLDLIVNGVDEVDRRSKEMCRFFQWADETPIDDERKIPSPTYCPEENKPSKRVKTKYTPRPKLQRQFAVSEKLAHC
ncbi:hypothetical protein ACROYT_G025975 [Oculina patagonica]